MAKKTDQLPHPDPVQTPAPPPSPNPWRRPLPLALAIAVLIAIPALGIYAATKKTVNYTIIQIQAINPVDRKIKSDDIPLQNVNVTLKGVNGGSCSPNPQLTATRPDVKTNDPHAGIAVFKCDNGGSSKKYVIQSATREGYEPANPTPHPLKTGTFTASAGHRGKARTNVATIYLVPTGSTATPPPPNNIVNTNSALRHDNLSRSVTKRDGGGEWIVNKVYGYYLGSVFDKWSIQVNHKNAAGTFAFGLILRPDGSKWGCGWIDMAVIQPGTDSLYDHTCDNQSAVLANRDSFGTQYNCDESHDWCDHSTGSMSLRTPCDFTVYKNYAAGKLSDPALPPPGKISTASKINYRYKSLDKNAAIVQTDLGWGFMQAGCIPIPVPGDAYYREGFVQPVGVGATTNHPAHPNEY